MLHQEVASDLTVVGGGLAGTCAAIAAARQGAKVALVQNRPVLGGNSSSEIRVWVCGATAHGVHHYARETGIMGELFVENQFRNPDGNPYYWDLVVLEAVRDEPNISLYLNTDVREVEADGPEDARVIRAVTGWMMGSERVLRFTSPAFLDASGDGLVGFLAGARYRTGREARAELNESWAPDVPDDNTLGSMILFYTKDVGHPVKFVPPRFARDITQTPIPERRVIRTDHNGCAYWWIEWGGEKDIVHDNEEIRDELQAAIYGIWDHIKNSGKFDADNLTLEWIGSVPGKREYRRFVGDYLMTQHDVLEQTEFTDRVAYGGWSIDLHPSGGMYATEQGSRHWHPNGNYHIPLRSLYSQNVTNMWMAGRTISCSHVAFGTTRVMATCAVVGEAAGTAAALGVRDGLRPAQLAGPEIDRLHRALVRADASVLGLANTDPDDVARAATVLASSTHRELGIPAEASVETYPLESPLGMVIPVDPALDGIEMLLDAAADTELVVDLHHTGKSQNYVPVGHVATARTPVSAGNRQWVRVDVPWRPETPRNAFIAVRANSSVSLHVADDAEPGTLFFRHREPPADEVYTEQWRAWKYILHRRSVCFRLTTPTDAFAPSQVVGGYARPYGGPQMWVSDILEQDPAPWIELSWDEPTPIREIAMIFDDEVEEDLINLHHHRTPDDVLPGLVRDYRVELEVAGKWQVAAASTDNRRRHRAHRLPAATLATKLRVVVEATNGAPRAHVVAVRAYASPCP